MGCLKLSYDQGEGVEENESSIFWKVYSKRESSSKKRVEYYRYGFQGEFAEEDSETGWNSFELRMYDPVIGRWLVPDPYDEFWSPYLAMGNDPVNLTDSDGGMTDPPEYAPQYLPEGSVTVTASRLSTPSFGFLDWSPAPPAPFDVLGSLINSGLPVSIENIASHLGRQLGPKATGAADPFFIVDNPATVAAEFANDVDEGNYAMAAFTLVTLGKGKYLRKFRNKSKVIEATLDATGKVHGKLPRIKDLNKYSKEELTILLGQLRQSVKQRIKVTSRMGRDRGHGQRQGAEQDLIKALEKYLGN